MANSRKNTCIGTNMCNYNLCSLLLHGVCTATKLSLFCALVIVVPLCMLLVGTFSTWALGKISLLKYERWQSEDGRVLAHIKPVHFLVHRRHYKPVGMYGVFLHEQQRKEISHLTYRSWKSFFDYTDNCLRVSHGKTLIFHIHDQIISPEALPYVVHMTCWEFRKMSCTGDVKTWHGQSMMPLAGREHTMVEPYDIRHLAVCLLHNCGYMCQGELAEPFTNDQSCRNISTASAEGTSDWLDSGQENKSTSSGLQHSFISAKTIIQSDRSLLNPGFSVRCTVSYCRDMLSMNVDVSLTAPHIQKLVVRRTSFLDIVALLASFSRADNPGLLFVNNFKR